MSCIYFAPVTSMSVVKSVHSFHGIKTHCSDIGLVYDIQDITSLAMCIYLSCVEVQSLSCLLSFYAIPFFNSF